jgi:hypothetical protein
MGFKHLGVIEILDLNSVGPLNLAEQNTIVDMLIH